MDEFELLNGEPAELEVLRDATCLRIVPKPRLDFWCRTFYEPLLLKDDAFALLLKKTARQIAPNKNTDLQVQVKMNLKGTSQFDQAGLFLRLDSENWIKVGVEVVDGAPKLSCVVTRNGKSDWSTVSLFRDGETMEAAHVVDLRVTFKHSCIAYDYLYHFEGISNGKELKWNLARIADITESDNW